MKTNFFLLGFGLLLIFMGCSFLKENHKISQKSEEAILCRNRKLSLKYLNVEKLDTLIYEEGRIYSIYTKDNSIVRFLCGSNAQIFFGENYEVLDSIKAANGNISLRGRHKDSKLFWRNDGIIGYERVRKKDTSRYNQILDNPDFLTLFKNP